MQKKDKPATVYNFEVEDFHTYFVGKSALWVHNTCESDVIALHAWSHCGASGGEFINHAQFGSVSSLQSKLQEFPYALKDVDFSDFIDGVMKSHTRREAIPDGTAYYDDFNKVIVIHRHDDDYITLADPGTCYRGNEQTFQNAVNERWNR